MVTRPTLARLDRALRAARRELRAPAPPVWNLIDPAAATEQFADRTVMVTGAAGFVGSALTTAFLAAGATVHAVDIDDAGLERLVAEHAAGDRLVAYGADLSDPDAIAALASSLDGLDVLVGNVGVNDDRRGVDSMTETAWRDVLDVNLVGPALLASALRPLLERSSSGAIVFVTSVNAVEESPWIHYAAAKAALGKLTADLAHDLVHAGVRVNAVAPGTVVRSEAPPATRMKHPYGLGGGGVPVEAVVHAVMFLADGHRSPMTTGQQLLVTGAPGRGGLAGR